MKAEFKIFHPHNSEVVEALTDRVKIIDNSSFIEEVLMDIAHLPPTTARPGEALEDSLILMSSDAGGFKPLMKLCDKLHWKGETYSASKARLSDGTILQNIGREDFKGKDILIVDDISVYGGTFKGLSKLLKERNCGKLYLAVSHMTIQEVGSDPVTDYFDKVFTTNSKWEHYYINVLDSPKKGFPNNLKVVKLFSK